MSSPFLANWFLLLHLLPELPLGPAPHLLRGITPRRGPLFFPSSVLHFQGVTKHVHTGLLHLSAKLVHIALFSGQVSHLIQIRALSSSKLSRHRHTVLHSGRNGLSKCKSDLITALKCLKSTWARYTMLICTWPLLAPAAFPIRILLSLCFAPHCPIAHVASTHCLARMPVHTLYSLHLGPPPPFPGGLPCIFQDNWVRDFNSTGIREQSTSSIRYTMSSSKAFVVLVFVFRSVNAS